MKKIISTVVIVFCLITAGMMIAGAEKLPESEIISQQEDFVPQFTLAPDSSLKDHGNQFVFSDKQAAVFYSQTTALALIAGYLILFKVRGIPKHEKLHRRK